MWHLPDALREIEGSGNPGIVSELVDSFQTDSARRFERMHRGLAERNAGTVKAEAHALRGSARQMGADSMAALCQTVEDRAREMNWPELSGQVKQAEAEFAAATRMMVEYLQATKRPAR